MSRVKHPRCPYCSGAVRPIDSKEACHACMAWHHEECWDEHGRCAACQAEGAPRKRAPAPKKKKLGMLSDVIVPAGMSVEPTADGLQLKRRWFGGQFIALAFFCMFWDGFMVVWFGIAITQQQWLMAAFGTLHGAVGVGLTYFTLAGFLNTTTIEIKRDRFRIGHSPLPWPGGHDLSANELDQLFCTRQVHHGENGTSVTFDLEAQLKGGGRSGKRVTLLKRLESLDQARFIERKVEEHLGIVDRPVEGEAGDEAE